MTSNEEETMMSEPAITVAAVEGGGTTFCIAVAQLNEDGTTNIVHRIRIESSHEDPERTLWECSTFLEGNRPPGGYAALGLATFGPVGLDPEKRDTYGCILSSSPKKAWRNVNILEPLIQACQGKERPLAVRVETDVSAPAWAEYELMKQERNITSLAYVTVGTGVGVGLVINDMPVHGRLHPEGGHVPVQPLEGDPFPGYSWGISKCPFQGKHTVEGIASSVALTERLQYLQGQKTKLNRNVLAELDDDDALWDHCANALASLCVTLILTTSIERIVFGGGVMSRNGLLEKVRKRTVKLMNGYVDLPEDMSELIGTSAWGDDAGLMGAVVLAQKAYQESEVEETSNDKSFRSGYLRGVLTGILLSVGVVALIGKRQGLSRST